MKRRLLILMFTSIALLGSLHWIGSMFYFYWDSFWFDEGMHFLGGFSMGLLFLWLWHVSGYFGESTPTKKEAMVGALVFAMMVSLGWEAFEFAHGIAVPAGGNYQLDTFNDLLFDFLGGVTAGFIGRIRSFYE